MGVKISDAPRGYGLDAYGPALWQAQGRTRSGLIVPAALSAQPVHVDVSQNPGFSISFIVRWQVKNLNPARTLSGALDLVLYRRDLGISFSNLNPYKVAKLQPMFVGPDGHTDDARDHTSQSEWVTGHIWEADTRFWQNGVPIPPGGTKIIEAYVGVQSWIEGNYSVDSTIWWVNPDTGQWEALADTLITWDKWINVRYANQALGSAAAPTLTFA